MNARESYLSHVEWFRARKEGMEGAELSLMQR